jgi:molybdopterin converting factor subunit 1
MTAPGIEVRVRLFGRYREIAGVRSVSLQFPAGSSVEDLVRHLREKPGLESLPPDAAVAVNRVVASRDRRITAGDEVALIPPVAGG